MFWRESIKRPVSRAKQKTKGNLLPVLGRNYSCVVMLVVMGGLDGKGGLTRLINTPTETFIVANLRVQLTAWTVEGLWGFSRETGGRVWKPQDDGDNVFIYHRT